PPMAEPASSPATYAGDRHAKPRHRPAGRTLGTCPQPRTTPTHREATVGCIELHDLVPRGIIVDLTVCRTCRRAVIERVRTDPPHRRREHGRTLPSSSAPYFPLLRPPRSRRRQAPPDRLHPATATAG